MPIYDPVGHDLLSTAAARLQPDVLAAQADAAEASLDAALAARGYGTLTDADHASGTPEYERAVVAVVYQLNYQVEAGTESEVYGSLSRGDKDFGFRGGVLNPMPAVSPRALAIAMQLAKGPGSSTWPAAGGLR